MRTPQCLQFWLNSVQDLTVQARLVMPTYVFGQQRIHYCVRSTREGNVFAMFVHPQREGGNPTRTIVPSCAPPPHPIKISTGYPLPQPGLDKVKKKKKKKKPPPLPRTGYGAGGTPLGFSRRRTFLHELETNFFQSYLVT